MDKNLPFGRPRIFVGDKELSSKEEMRIEENGEITIVPAYREINFREGGTQDAVQRTEKEDSETEK